ncbi:MAG: stage II sporulation protein R [Oscillospiraceae bacterium]|nr:stage II sporulation protein R [Oscillospiraceae bacterium]
MKRLLKSVIFALTFCFILMLVPFEGQCREISDKVFRVHILANSDSEADQELKLRVRDALVNAGEEILKDVESKEEAERLIEKNIPKLKSIAENVVFQNGYDYPVDLEITNMYFDTRHYGNITMPGGFYDALRVKIGKAEGKNWWCVMFPSLCIYSVSKTETLEENLSDGEYKIISSENEYQYRFKIVEIFTGICNFFKG